MTSDNQTQKIEIKIPKKIIDRISQLNIELNSLLSAAEAKMRNPWNRVFRFLLQHSAPLPCPLPDQQAAFHSFIMKLKLIPDYSQPQIVTDGTEFRLGNIDLARNVIAEWRPILFNQSDPIYYKKIHNTFAKMLTQKNHGAGAVQFHEIGRLSFKKFLTLTLGG